MKGGEDKMPHIFVNDDMLREIKKLKKYYRSRGLHKTHLELASEIMGKEEANRLLRMVDKESAVVAKKGKEWWGI